MAEKKKKVWILNQHTYLPQDGPNIRHYALAKYLARDGYEPYVFAGNQLHCAGVSLPVSEKGYTEVVQDGIHFYYVKIHHYVKNDIHRVLSIFSYYFNVLKVAKEIEKKYGKPDIIYASTMTPAALVAGNKLAKKYGIKSINETRDIIPEGFMKKDSKRANGLIANALRKFMKRTYERSDALIFTMSNGPKYIEDMKWDKAQGGKIQNDRIYYVNNGVDRELSNYYAENFFMPDEHLDDDSLFNVVYFGAIRLMNQMPLFVDAAKELKRLGYDNIKILMWGKGIKLDETRQAIKDAGLDNIILKGYVEKKYIPAIAKRSNLFIMTTNFSCVDRYGASPNKLFDYFQAGKPIIVPTLLADSMIESNHAGSELDDPDGVKLAHEIIRYATMDKQEYQSYCDSSEKMAEQFDYAVHAKSIEKIFDDLSL